jgi:hypothetical protein
MRGIGWRASGGVGVVLLAATALSGCNMAVSPAPLITDGRPVATLLAEGRWFSFASDCHIRSRALPSCADQFEVRGGRIIADAKSVPPISVQLPTGAREGFAQVELAATADQPRTFGYVGFRVEARAGDGRIRRFVVWPVLCRIPPEKDTKPLSGLTPHTDDTNCDASARDTIEAAAKASEPTAAKTEFRRIAALDNPRNERPSGEW